MALLAAKTVRIACNQAATTSAVDENTKARPVFWRGAPALVQCALFTGVPASDTFVTDVSNIVTIELLIRKHNANGTLLLSKVLFAGTDIVPSSWAAWFAKTGQQFTFSLAESFLSWPVPDSGSLPVYFVINVITATSNYVAAFGYGQLVDVGIVDMSAPQLPTAFIDLTPSTAGNTDIVTLRGLAVVRLVPIQTGIAFTYNLSLLTTDEIPGAYVDLYIEIPPTANITIEVRTYNAAGPIIHTVTGNNDFITYQHVPFRFDGNEWIKFGPAIT